MGFLVTGDVIGQCRLIREEKLPESSTHCFAHRKILQSDNKPRAYQGNFHSGSQTHLFLNEKKIDVEIEFSSQQMTEPLKDNRVFQFYEKVLLRRRNFHRFYELRDKIFNVSCLTQFRLLVA